MKSETKMTLAAGGVLAGLIAAVYLYKTGKQVTQGLGQLPYAPLRLGPEELTQQRGSLEWGLALPRSDDPSTCAAMGSGPAAQACFELQRSKQHLKHYMEGRGGKASLDASNQAMEQAVRAYASMYRQPPVGVRRKLKGALGTGVYGG